jgi:outer membrane protein TolC
MRTSVVVALALPLLAGACLVGPDFQRPQTAQVSTYAAASDRPLPADQQMVPAGAAPTDWWSSFQAPQLDSIVTLALAGNQDIAVAKARVAEAEESVKSASGALLPQLSLGAHV